MLGGNDFFGRTSHVNVDSGHSHLLQGPGGLAEGEGVVAEQLHEVGVFLDLEIKPPPHLFAAQKPVRAGELAEQHHFPVEAPHQPAVRGVGNSVHRRQADDRARHLGPF